MASPSNTSEGGSLVESMPLEEMDKDDLVDWLLEKNIPVDYCTIFSDNYIDGKEFLSLSEDEVKKMIPPIGLAKKIIRLIPKKEATQDVIMIPETNEANSATPPVSNTAISTTPPVQTPSRASTSESSGGVSSTVSSKDTKCPTIPSNWSSSTQKAINDKKLDSKVCCDIVRTLVTLLIAKSGPNPKRAEVEQFSRQLILKYPYMRDDIGTGYASWYEKMLERLRNVRKRSKTDGDCDVVPKRSKTCPKQSLMKRYPPCLHTSREDDDTIKKHLAAMTAEMTKKKPRDVVLLPLLKQTYSSRRDYITSTERRSVAEILEEYPALRVPKAIEQDMILVFINETENVKQVFFQKWPEYVTAILTFVKPKSSDFDPSDSYSQDSTALKTLIDLFKCEGTLMFEETEDDVESIMKRHPNHLSPRMIAVKSRGSGHEFFIVTEQLVLCEVSSFCQGLFLMLCSYYVFHLKYPDKCKKVFLFLQDYVLCQPDNFEVRKGAYLAIASDIKKCLTID